MKQILIITLIVFVQCKVEAQQINTDSTQIAKIFDWSLNHAKAYDNLNVLCKKIGHRLSGSAGMYKAENWALRTLKEMPFDTVYFQECMVPKWVRGKNENASFVFINNKSSKTKGKYGKLNVLSLGNSEGTNGKPIIGPLVIINDFDELEKRKDEIKGKIVLYNFAFKQSYIRTFNGYGDAVKYRSTGASRAAKYGAIAVLVRSVSTAPDNHPHTGALRYDTNYAKIPALAIGVNDAILLNSLYKNGKIDISINSDAHMEKDTIGHNVIGEIYGTNKLKNYITVGGHLDSWDIGEGAHDDGAGCVQSMEVANILAAINYKPKNNIRVVLFANEENGLRGGTKHAEKAIENNENHIAAIESDAGGFSPRAFTGTMNNEQLQKFKSWLPLLWNYGITEMNSGGGGADIGPLKEKMNTPVIGLSPDSQRYFDLHHATTDVFEAVNKRELHLGAAAMAALIYLIDLNGL
jgi:carboxypeptidase Q